MCSWRWKKKTNHRKENICQINLLVRSHLIQLFSLGTSWEFTLKANKIPSHHKTDFCSHWKIWLYTSEILKDLDSWSGVHSLYFSEGINRNCHIPSNELPAIWAHTIQQRASIRSTECSWFIHQLASESHLMLVWRTLALPSVGAPWTN